MNLSRDYAGKIVHSKRAVMRYDRFRAAPQPGYEEILQRRGWELDKSVYAPADSKETTATGICP